MKKNKIEPPLETCKHCRKKSTLRRGLPKEYRKKNGYPMRDNTWVNNKIWCLCEKNRYRWVDDSCGFFEKQTLEMLMKEVLKNGEKE